jgi:mRNA-degrading endonuclease RelE of RelBE toxin-antitoxin system
MDELEKLFRKVQRKDRQRLFNIVDAMRRGDLKGLTVKKLAGSPLYRVRVGDFRILFSLQEKNGGVVIESVRRRNERTYE